MAAGGEPPDLESTTFPWGIFYSPAGNFLGRLTRTDERTGIMTLYPAYSYIAQTSIEQQGGRIARPRYIVPIELIVSAMTVELPPCPVVWIATYDEIDREDLRKGIASAEAMRAKLRSSRSGLALVPAGAKLPPFPPVRGL